jgi:hypothetical protein
MVADKRSGIKFGSCGVTEGLGLTVEVRCALWQGVRGSPFFVLRTNNDSDLRLPWLACTGCCVGRQAARAARHREPRGQPRQLGCG